MKTGIKILSAKYDQDYKIDIIFSDGTINKFDYKSLVTSNHEEFKQYLDITKFKKFKINNTHTEIVWGVNWEMILPLHVLYSKKYVRPRFLVQPKEKSVTEYAKSVGLTRQAILSQIKNKKISAKKVGSTYVIY